jgi:hypothetical protein
LVHFCPLSDALSLRRVVAHRAYHCCYPTP